MDAVLTPELTPELSPDLALLAFCIEARDRAAMMKQIGLRNIQKKIRIAIRE